MTARASKRVGVAGWLGASMVIVAVGISACGDDGDCTDARTCPTSPGEGGTTASEGGASSNAGSVLGSGASSQTDAGATGVGGNEPVECTTFEDCDDGQPGNGTERCGADGLCEFGNPPPSVVAVSPDADATEVEPDSEVVITFSESIEAATVTQDNIQLLDDGVPIAATLTHEGERVTLTPASPLALFARYEVAVQTGVTDEAGVGLLEAHSSTFRVRDGAWHTSNATTGTLYELSDTLPITASGDVLIAWIARTPPNSPATYYCPTSANWFNRGVALSPEPAIFTALDIQDCRSVTAGANADGVGVVVWQEDYEYAQQFRGGVWGSPKQPVSFYGSSHLYTSAVAPDGSISFFQHLGNRTVVSRADAAGEWSTTVDDISSSTGLSSVSVAFDAEGNGFAAWAARDSLGLEKILVSRFTKVTGVWDDAKFLSGSAATSPDFDRGPPAVAVDSQGGALVLWTKMDAAAPRTLMATRFTEGGWSAPSPISGDRHVVAPSESPALVFDGETFVAAWSVGGSGASIQTASFDMELNQFWTPEVRNVGAAAERMPRLVADAHHHLLLVWAAIDGGSTKLSYSRYDALGASWSEPADVMGGIVHDAGFRTSGRMPLSMNASGLGALMWGDKNAQGVLSVIRLASFH